MLLSVCVPPIANGSLTKIFETVIVLSSRGSVFVTSFILITSERSERKSNSAGDILEKQYGL